VGGWPAADANEFARMVSPEHFVAVRDRFGGPAPAALERALDGYRAALVGFEAQAREIAAREAQAAAELDRRILEIAGGA
jgi:argininosuccinate lyase